MAGYFSQSLFNRKFKEICKMSPTVYRKNWINVNNE
ncbi:MAG: AraC family transcriptional regulator [Parabacteroides sp.]